MRILAIVVICALLISIKARSWEKVLFLSHDVKALKSASEEKSGKKAPSNVRGSFFYLKVYVDRALLPYLYSLKPKSKIRNGYDRKYTKNKKLIIQNFSNDTVLKEVFEGFDVDVDFGYSGIKQTKSGRPLELNYEGIEEPILTGFEAKEALISYYEFIPTLSLLAHVSLHEKYTSKKLEIEPDPDTTLSKESVIEYTEQKYLQTVKYGLGLRWKKKFFKETQIVLDAFWLHKADNHWQIENLTFKEHEYLGSVFDSWKLSISLLF